MPTLKAVRTLAEAMDAVPGHLPTFDQDYGVRFVCSCGEVSPFFSRLDGAREAFAQHATGRV